MEGPTDSPVEMRNICPDGFGSSHRTSALHLKSPKPALRLSVQHGRTASLESVHRDKPLPQRRSRLSVNGACTPSTTTSPVRMPSLTSLSSSAKPLPAPPPPPRPDEPPIPETTASHRSGPRSPSDPRVRSISSRITLIEEDSPVISISAYPDCTLRQSPRTGGTSTASPSTVCSVSEPADCADSSPVTSVSDKASPRSPALLAPWDPQRAALKAEFQGMMEVSGEAKRIRRILSRRVKKLKGLLGDRDAVINKVIGEMRQCIESGAGQEDPTSSSSLGASAGDGNGAAVGRPVTPTVRAASTGADKPDPHDPDGGAHLSVLEDQVTTLLRLLGEKNARIVELEGDVLRWEDDIKPLERAVGALAALREETKLGAGTHDDANLSKAMSELEQHLAGSVVETEANAIKALSVRKGASSSERSRSVCRQGEAWSSSENDPDSEPMVRSGGVRCACGAGPIDGVAGPGNGGATCDAARSSPEIDYVVRRLCDLEQLNTEQAEHIRLYRLDVKGYKKDVRQLEKDVQERDGKIKDLQGVVLDLQKRLGEAEGQVLLPNDPLGIDFRGSVSPPATLWLAHATDDTTGEPLLVPSIGDGHLPLAMAKPAVPAAVAEEDDGPCVPRTATEPVAPCPPRSAGRRRQHHQGGSRSSRPLRSMAGASRGAPAPPPFDPIIEETESVVGDNGNRRGSTVTIRAGAGAGGMGSARFPPPTRALPAVPGSVFDAANDPFVEAREKRKPPS